MKAKTITFTSALLFAAVCFVGSAVSFAQDNNIGTWKLNETKSKLAPGTPKNHTVIYEAAGDSVKVTVDGTDAAGAATHNEWTGKFDGKEYAVTGDAGSDMRSYTVVDANTMTLTIKKAGKTTVTGKIAVAADGKSRMVITKGKDAQGKEWESVAIYDKQ